VVIVLLIASLLFEQYGSDGDTWLKGVQGWYARLGYKLKLEKVLLIRDLDDLPSITFTQAHPIRTVHGWRLVYDPKKFLGAFSHQPGWEESEESRGKRMRAIALSELAMSQGVPIQQAFAEWLLARTAQYRVGRLDRDREYRLSVEGRARLPMRSAEVTPQARIDYARAYGISPTEQVAWEEYIATCPLNLSGTVQAETVSAVLFPGDPPAHDGVGVLAGPGF
jgi:hypothetical protein